MITTISLLIAYICPQLKQYSSLWHHPWRKWHRHQYTGTKINDHTCILIDDYKTDIIVIDDHTGTMISDHTGIMIACFSLIYSQVFWNDQVIDVECFHFSISRDPFHANYVIVYEALIKILPPVSFIHHHQYLEKIMIRNTTNIKPRWLESTSISPILSDHHHDDWKISRCSYLALTLHWWRSFWKSGQTEGSLLFVISFYQFVIHLVKSDIAQKSFPDIVNFVNFAHSPMHYHLSEPGNKLKVTNWISGVWLIVRRRLYQRQW